MLLSAAIGNTPWREIDYMDFWLLNEAGPNVNEIRSRPMGLTTFERAIHRGVDLNVMSDRRLSREERRPQYGRLVMAHAGVMLGGEVSIQPMGGFISLVDTGLSLGSEAEKEYARRLRIPASRVTPVKPAEIAEAVQVQGLREDLYVIKALGAKVCVAAEGAMLVLVRDDEQAPPYEQAA
jgi:hypothetical protein